MSMTKSHEFMHLPEFEKAIQKENTTNGRAIMKMYAAKNLFETKGKKGGNNLNLDWYLAYKKHFSTVSVFPLKPPELQYR